MLHDADAVAMWTVPVPLRPAGQAFQVICMHMFGDVPLPPVIGVIQSGRLQPMLLLCSTCLHSWLHAAKPPRNGLAISTCRDNSVENSVVLSCSMERPQQTAIILQVFDLKWALLS